MPSSIAASRAVRVCDVDESRHSNLLVNAQNGPACRCLAQIKAFRYGPSPLLSNCGSSNVTEQAGSLG